MKKQIIYVYCGLIIIILISLILLSLPKEEERAGRQEKTILTMMLPQTHYKDFFIQLIKKFEDEHQAIRIEPQVIPDNMWTEVVKTKIQVRETPDIIRIDKPLIQEVGTGHFIEMTDRLPWYGRAIPQQLESKMLDGRLYGLPVGSGSEFGIIYNRKIFERYSLQIPQNMEDFREICQTLKEEGIVPLYASDKDTWTVQVPFNTIAPQAVSDSIWEQLESGQIKWGDVPEFEQILQDMRSLREDGYTNADYMNATYTSAQNAIAREEAAMYIMEGFFIQDVQALNPDIDLMIFSVPYGEDVLTVIEGTGQLSIFRDSAHPQEAAVFLDWLSQPENMDTFTEGWSIMPIFADQTPQLSAYQQFLQDTYIQPKRTVLSVQDRIPGIDWNGYWNLQQDVFAGRLTPKEALGQWDSSFARQIGRKER